MKSTVMILAVFAAASAYSAQEFNFNIDPAKTWTDGYARIRLHSQGNFKGAYDPVKNLLGTRTKAGAGPFTSLTQNDPVPAMPFFEFGRAALVRTSGSFHLSVNTSNLTVTLSDYHSNRVPSSNLVLSGSVALNNDVFRTASPEAVYNANLPPATLGLIHVDKFTVSQRASTNTGTMVRLDDGSYRVSINFMADVQLRVAEFGQFAPMTFAVPYSLVGNLKVNGMSAMFGYPRGTGGESVTRNVNLTLQPFPLTFDTVQVPALFGTYMMDTTVKVLGISIMGTRQMVAVSI